MPTIIFLATQCIVEDEGYDITLVVGEAHYWQDALCADLDAVNEMYSRWAANFKEQGIELVLEVE